MSKQRVEVLLPVALDRSFTYSVPGGMAAGPGSLVEVPLGRRMQTGIVWGPGDPDVPGNRLKPLAQVHDRPALPPETLKFVDWVARYTLAPAGMVLRIALRGAYSPGEEVLRRAYILSGKQPGRMTPAREKVLEAAGDGLARTKTDLARHAKVSTAVIDGLVKDGALITIELPPEPVGSGLNAEHAHPKLNPDQERVANALIESVRTRSFSTHLLEGVTGAGKTEAYLEAAAETLRFGRQALILLPEIALTRAIMERVTARFGAPPGEWHSTVSAKRRARIWEGVTTGDTQIVVGARSALFLPFRDLGLIIVDEEHDSGFKQEDTPVYHARDMAVVRGQIGQAPVVLVSATPSIETRVNADAGRYIHHTLPSRFGGRALPDITLLDMRTDPPEAGRWIAPSLEKNVRDTLERGEQALLFLNRRGFAPLTLCRACGHRFQCPNCTSWLVEHRFRRKLVCHHCGHHEDVPPACPKCETVGKLAAVGPGVERIRDEAASLFPDARLSVLSSDITVGAERMRAELDAITKHEVDLIVGTQLVTKGHNFPHLTLVGVVDGDLGLSTSDPRAAERTFQLLEQVTGRAGRGEKPGRGFIQTYDPDHPVMQTLRTHDSEGFYRAEIAARDDAALPPFGRLASLIVSAPSKAEAENHARALAQAFPDNPSVRLLGPAEPPLALIRGRHRMRLILRSPRNVDLSSFIRNWLENAPSASGTISVQVDMDPVSFL